MAKVTILGHRGARVGHAENTVAAFTAALSAGADGVELDVRAGPSDRPLLVRHDPLPDVIPDGVITLAEALDACRGAMVNVEIKNLPTEPDWDPDERVAAAVVDLLAARGHVDRVVVSAFTLTTIDGVRAASPDVATGWLTPDGYDQLAAVATAVERGHNGLHPFHTAVTAELVAAVHDAGLRLTTWTVNNPRRMLELAAMGVDTLITDDPALAVATLSRVR